MDFEDDYQENVDKVEKVINAMGIYFKKFGVHYYDERVPLENKKPTDYLEDIERRIRDNDPWKESELLPMEGEYVDINLKDLIEWHLDIHEKIVKAEDVYEEKFGAPYPYWRVPIETGHPDRKLEDMEKRIRDNDPWKESELKPVRIDDE